MILADPVFVSSNNLKIEDVVQIYTHLLQGNYSEYTILSVEFSTSTHFKITKGTFSGFMNPHIYNRGCHDEKSLLFQN